MSDTTMTPKFYTIREVADTLRVHSRTAYRLVTEGSIKAIKIGSQWRIPQEALMEFIESGWRESLPQKDDENRGPKQLKLPF